VSIDTAISVGLISSRDNLSKLVGWSNTNDLNANDKKIALIGYWAISRAVMLSFVTKYKKSMKPRKLNCAYCLVTNINNIVG